MTTKLQLCGAVFALAFFPGLTSAGQDQGVYSGVSAALPTGSPAVSARGLVAAYDFETYTEDGKLRDFSPNGNHGAVKRRQETPGLFGAARIFTDLNDVVDIPEDRGLNLSGPLTVVAWMKNNTPGLHQHILSCDDIFVLWTTSQDQYRLADTQANGLTTAAGTAPIGRWHSVVAVLDATRGDALTEDNIKVYVDGVRVAGVSEPQWAPGALRPQDGCLIGAAVSGDLAHQQLRFEGAIDEMLVFSRALNDQEIRAYAGR